MDNLAHTLAGAALGEAGLKRKTGLGLATLMIAANLPDLDVVGLAFGENLAWRRGWTHGPLALVVLPPLLAFAMAAFDRWQGRRGTRPADRPLVNLRWLLALAFIGFLSHPLMDFLNTYGIRCLMPFSDRWFYGDALFIIDVWLWAALGFGIWLARRRARDQDPHPGRPAIAALALVALYAGGMGALSLVVERLVAEQVAASVNASPLRVLASPVPIDPLRRQIVFDMGGAYGFGEFAFLPVPRLTIEPDLLPTRMDDPALGPARRLKPIADYLYWSRWPFAGIVRRPGWADITLSDARYSRVPSGGLSLRISVPE